MATKTLRLDYSKGLNLVQDRRMVPDGYLALADNVDSRSGSARSLSLPQFQHAAPSGTKCLFEYRGKWYYSSLYRHYAAELSGSQERVYFSEDGKDHIPPQKIVNGIQAGLGTHIPVVPLAATASGHATPQGLTISGAIVGGALKAGTYSYRISAIIKGNVCPAAQRLTVALIPADPSDPNSPCSGIVTLAWNPVENATGYLVFGRTLEKEQALITLGAAATSWQDNGSRSPSGSYATDYDVTNPLQYVYTFLRSVGGMADESGPSPLSVSVTPTGQPQLLSRMALSDGFYEGATSLAGLTSAASSTYSIFGGFLLKGIRSILTLSTAPDQTIWEGGKARLFSGLFWLNSIDYPFAFPVALATPSWGATPLTAGTGGSLANGAYHYKITAIRGQSTGLTGGLLPGSTPVAETEASAGQAITLSGASDSIILSWLPVSDADGYRIYRQNPNTTWDLVKTITTQSKTYEDTGTSESTGVTVPSVNHTSDRVVVFQGLPIAADFIGSGYGQVWLARTIFTYTAKTGLHEGDAIYISGCIQTALNGVQAAHLIPIKAADLSAGTKYIILSLSQMDGSSPTDFTALGSLKNIVGTKFTATGSGTGTGTAALEDSTEFAVNVYTASTEASATGLFQANNNYITSWRVYRTGDTGSNYSLAGEVPITEGTFLDVISTVNLGNTISSSYQDEDGIPVTFAPPPSDLKNPTLYNGMLFGIQGNTVRWTPTSAPDAWPDFYSMTFESRPVALKSFAGGLQVLTGIGIWRIDGFRPGALNRTQTKADGCIAPGSIQQIGNTLLYLGKRGVMAFNGVTSECITERTIPYKLMLGPSQYPLGLSAPSAWWLPTAGSSLYGAILNAANNNFPASDSFGHLTAHDLPQEGIINTVRSFVWQNKYHLFFSNAFSPDYEANTCWIVDMSLPEFPVTTCGLKAFDAHVSATSEVYLLLGNDPDHDGSADALRTKEFLKSQSGFGDTFNPAAGSGISVYHFNPPRGIPIPMRIRSSEIAGGVPYNRKRWREICIHGDGSGLLRLYVDGGLVTFADGSTEQSISCTEGPTHPRRVVLPIGSWGTTLSYDLIFLGSLRLLETTFDPMSSEE